MITYELFKCSKFGSLINFQCHYNILGVSLNCDWSVLLDQTLLWLGREGIKEREEGKRGGGGGGLFEGGDYFKYFRLNSSLLRGILFERRLIEGRLFFEEIRYILFHWVGGPETVNKHMIIVLFFWQSNYAFMASFASFRERFSSGAVRVFPGPFDLTCMALGTLFSYGFPTKPCAGPCRSYDNLWWITWHYIYQLLIYPYLTYGFVSWGQSLKTHLNKILIV